mmetsp:Transcript_50583/g.81757  ORF Transcript_50583/g.81757 Transcript_50583/m.81757 type:complete len:306 (-) Transcript_50583:1010-1927(-)
MRGIISLCCFQPSDMTHGSIAAIVSFWSFVLRANLVSTTFHVLISFCTSAKASLRDSVALRVRSIVGNMTMAQSPKVLSCANLRPLTSMQILSGLTPSSTPRLTISSTSFSKDIAGPASSSSSVSSSEAVATAAVDRLTASIASSGYSPFMRAPFSSSFASHCRPLPPAPTIFSFVMTIFCWSESSSSSDPKPSSSSPASSFGFSATQRRVLGLIVTPAATLTPHATTQLLPTSACAPITALWHTIQLRSTAPAPTWTSLSKKQPSTIAPSPITHPLPSRLEETRALSAIRLPAPITVSKPMIEL